MPDQECLVSIQTQATSVMLMDDSPQQNQECFRRVNPHGLGLLAGTFHQAYSN